MRDRLAKLAGMRALYRAKFVRYGVRYKHDHTMTETVLLSEVTTLHGLLLCDHVWMSESAPFHRLELKPEDRIQFVATAEQYRRRDGKQDYRLSTLTRLRKV